MKRSRCIGLILSAALATSAALAPLTALAQTDQTDTQTPGASPVDQTQIDNQAPGAAPSANANQAATADKPGGGAANGDLTKVFGPVMGTIMMLFAWLMGAAGVLLNDTVYFTVIHMGSYINGLSAVGIAWKVLRDLGNMILIFGFLAIGISTILDVKWYGSGKELLPKLLLAAIFLNFSLFISEAVIDTGNIFAAQFYTQINGGIPPTLQGLSDIGNNGLSNTLMNQLGLQTLYDINHGAGLNFANEMFIGFLGIILFLIAAFVMYSISLILITRFVMLIYVIITAPIGFAGLAVPKLDKYAKEWWDRLLEQTFVAPILLIGLYIALAVITDAKFLTGFGIQNGANGTAAGYAALTGGATNSSMLGFANILLSFLVAMGLLMACTILAKSWSKTTSKWVSGMVSYPGRSIARYASGYSGLGLQKLNTAIQSTRTGRNIGRVLSVASAGALSDYEISKAAGRMQSAKFETSSSVSDLRSFGKTRATELDSINRKRKAKQEIEDAQRDSKSGDPTTRENADRRITKALQTLSDKEISELQGIKNADEALVRNLSPQQFKNLMENKEVSEATKAKARTTRFATVNSAVEKAEKSGDKDDIDAARKEIGKLNNKELSYIGEDFLTKKFVAENMSDDQSDYVKKEGILPAGQVAAIENQRKMKFGEEATATTVGANILGLKGNIDQLGKIPPSAFVKKDPTNPTGKTLRKDVLDQLGVNEFEGIRRGKLDAETKLMIGEYLKTLSQNAAPNDARAARIVAFLNTNTQWKRDFAVGGSQQQSTPVPQPPPQQPPTQPTPVPQPPSQGLRGRGTAESESF